VEFNSFGPAVGRLGSDSSRGAKLRQSRSRGAEPPLAPPHFNHCTQYIHNSHSSRSRLNILLYCSILSQTAGHRATAAMTNKAHYTGLVHDHALNNKLLPEWRRNDMTPPQLKTCGLRTFSVAALMARNSLPDIIQDPKSTADCFRCLYSKRKLVRTIGVLVDPLHQGVLSDSVLWQSLTHLPVSAIFISRSAMLTRAWFSKLCTGKFFLSFPLVHRILS